MNPDNVIASIYIYIFQGMPVSNDKHLTWIFHAESAIMEIDRWHGDINDLAFCLLSRYIVAWYYLISGNNAPQNKI